jgi:FtsH-binding integral membrane protein
MKRTSLLFLLLLGVLLSISFGLHLLALHFTENDLFGNQIILSYVVNFILAAIVLVVVEKTLNKNSAQAGFVFMAGSGLKFLVFFLVFYPIYNEDSKMQSIEFTAFFIPYAICLITEVIYLSKQLNNQSI